MDAFFIHENVWFLLYRFFDDFVRTKERNRVALTIVKLNFAMKRADQIRTSCLNKVSLTKCFPDITLHWGHCSHSSSKLFLSSFDNLWKTVSIRLTKLSLKKTLYVEQSCSTPRRNNSKHFSEWRRSIYHSRNIFKILNNNLKI